MAAILPSSLRWPGGRTLARRLSDSGLLEALTAPHGVDGYLALIAPGRSHGDLRAEIAGVHRPTDSSVTLRLAPRGDWRGFQAGQFVTLTVEIDGVRRSRCYSPAGSQHARSGELELTIRTHEHGLVSRHLREHARPGMTVGLSQAAGDFVLPTPRPERLLLISGGSGITPVMSMLRTLCDEGHEAAVTFLHYTRHEREHPYRSELQELARRHRNVRVHTLATRGPGRARDRHLSAAQLRAIDRRHRDAEVYVCGPPALLDAARALWAAEPQRLHTETFKPSQPVVGACGNGGTVRFTASGVETSATAISLLEQAEQAGLQPAYGCRMGICHTCTTSKLAGQVRDLRTGKLSSTEPQELQLCVSTAAGDVDLDL